MRDFYVTDYGVRVNDTALQTKQIQAVPDLCRECGGRVVFPKGRYDVSSLWLRSDTTLYLEAGTEIYGSTECDDYEVFAIHEEVEMRSDEDGTDRPLFLPEQSQNTKIVVL